MSKQPKFQDSNSEFPNDIKIPSEAKIAVEIDECSHESWGKTHIKWEIL